MKFTNLFLSSFFALVTSAHLYADATCLTELEDASAVELAQTLLHNPDVLQKVGFKGLPVLHNALSCQIEGGDQFLLTGRSVHGCVLGKEFGIVITRVLPSNAPEGAGYSYEVEYVEFGN
jgi:hypothetical protein